MRPETDVLVRMPVVQFLRDCGHRVVEAVSTDEAMAILQKTDVPVDVVVSEIDIPGLERHPSMHRGKGERAAGRFSPLLGRRANGGCSRPCPDRSKRKGRARSSRC